MSNLQPIGFFDSGVGGTSVWKEVVQLLPHENTIYLADSKHAPYGRKSKDEITKLCIKNTDYLLSRGCKLIAVPCNTATTNSISYLREHYDVPFIGIEPAIKPAALNSATGKIGILATQGTLSSELFNRTQKAFTKDVNTIEIVGTGIVELIESGKKDSEEMRDLLVSITEPFMISGIDYLVLGCSHYPYIKDILQELLPSRVKIIDSGAAVARQTLHILKEFNILNNQTALGHHELYSNLNTQVLDLLTVEVNNRRVDYLDF
ncbi:glutamate racemase [Nonlabens arenilitoris]|uniref:Glutamate racemase n=1 Tax=Nonlabens arenilitoris TaxID=1217969 RepID=A0A2S7U9E6_9FLAO|nr:glutamate racemase [Nonlabens arenilitoris]PQJ31267.1 glutamate racemase [Nonlabens arenilitoris]